MTTKSEHIDTLARTLFGESVPHNIEDATAIAAVIMNRVKLPNWPATVSEVCLQPYQFSCWNVSDPNRARIAKASGDWFDQCKEIATAAVDKKLDDPTTQSTHYHTPAVNPKWSRKKVPVYQTAGHYFFNDIDTAPPKTAKQALDQKAPLSESRTMQGGKIATAGVTGSGLAELVTEASGFLEPLAAYADTMKYLFLIITLVGIGLTMHARWDDRRKGKV